MKLVWEVETYFEAAGMHRKPGDEAPRGPKNARRRFLASYARELSRLPEREEVASWFCGKQKDCSGNLESLMEKYTF